MKKSVTLLFLLCVLMFSCKQKDDLALYGDMDGIITDAISNQPIQGVVVSLNISNSSKATGTDGKYEFKSLDAGDYTIQATKSGYVANTKTVTVIAGESIKGDLTLVPIVPVLQVSVTSLDFGNNLTSLPVAIRNTGMGSLDWNISETSDWISVNPISGSTTTQTSNIIISVDRSTLTSGNYSQTVTITSNGGNATIAVSIVK